MAFNQNTFIIWSTFKNSFFDYEYGDVLTHNVKKNSLFTRGPLFRALCIISLTMLLRRQLLKYIMPTTLSNPLLFLLKKCENFFNKK